MDTPLVAATIAASAAVFAAAMSWVAAHQARRSSDRTHAWTRLTWAVDHPPGDPGYDMSRAVLRAIAALRWAPMDDRRLAERLLERLARRTATHDEGRPARPTEERTHAEAQTD